MSEAKRLAGEKAIEFVEDGMIVGVGTGSTVAYFIDALGRVKDRIKGAVSSSEQSTARLKQHGIEVLDLNHTGTLSLYVDGADECDPHKRLIKGGGAALTREKIIAEASKTFVCIVDPSKQVPILGKFPLPVEVIPMARSLVAREILRLTGGQGAGLAYQILQAGFQLNIPRMFAALLLISLTGVALFVLMAWCTRRALGGWHASESGSD